ncbi:MAG: hypothetical protein ACFFEN_03070 [Candidatus Thorarchaeota archaeon]
MNKKLMKIYSFSLLLIIIFTNFLFIFISNFDFNRGDDDENNLKSSGEILHSKQWLKNNDFSTQDHWYSEKGTQGDNSTVDANISNGYGNYKVLGENETFQSLSGKANASSWAGWGIYNNSDFLLPDVTAINQTGCYVYHFLDEGEGPLSQGQVHNFPSVHFKKNITLPVNFSDYEITSASLTTIFNASVDSNVDAPGDTVDQSAIWDSATFYVEIADLDLSYSFRVAEYKTTNLGQDTPPILSITDTVISTVSESDLITALNLALEKHIDHSKLTIILGLDIYCEDNIYTGSGDLDLWKALIFKSFNLTFEYERKIDKFSSVSLNQIGNTISGGNIQITSARLFFMYKIDKPWVTTASPFSEMRVLINGNQHPETIRLSSAINSFQDAKSGGFDVTYLILKDVNITVSIQVYIANTFSLGKNITISIDDVYLNITYSETIPDTQTKLDLFLENDNKTADPVIQIQSNELLNVTVKYNEKQSGSHIINATVQLQGKITVDLLESLIFEQYTAIINTSELGIGIKTLSIVAQKNNYETQILQFFVEVIEIATELTLKVNDIITNDSDTIDAEVNQFLNITVFYRNNETEQHLSGATVDLTGFGKLNETANYYNITIPTNELDQGITVLTINALVENYQPQTIQFYVELSERATDIKLFINNSLTLVPVYEATIGTMVNITVKYFDNLTGIYIPNAIAQIDSEAFSANLTEVIALEQYSISFNTSLLKIGVNLLKLIVYANNYQIKTILIRITVKKISGAINTIWGKSIFEVTPGSIFLLRVVLNNTEFGGIIKNANVTYRWAYGQGELIDLNNDGIYEANITIPQGLYSLTIDAYAGEDFAFQSYEITISSIPVSGKDFTWLVYLLIGGIIGLVSIFTLYQTYFKYPPMVRKIRKLKKKIRKERKTKPMLIVNRYEIITKRIKDQNKSLDLENIQSDKIEKSK